MPSVVLCLAKLCKGAKLEVGVRTGLICQYCRGVTISNTVAFTGDGVGDCESTCLLLKMQSI